MKMHLSIVKSFKYDYYVGGSVGRWSVGWRVGGLVVSLIKPETCWSPSKHLNIPTSEPKNIVVLV